MWDSVKPYMVDGEPYKLNIYDYAEWQEKCEQARNNYFDKKKGAVHDVSKETDYENQLQPQTDDVQFE